MTKPNVPLNFGILALDRETRSKVFHVCTYENPPDENDFESLRHELETDQEFGLTDRDFILVCANPRFLDSIKDDIKTVIAHEMSAQ